jgi:hypothetical protein
LFVVVLDYQVPTPLQERMKASYPSMLSRSRE